MLRLVHVLHRHQRSTTHERFGIGGALLLIDENSGQSVEEAEMIDRRNVRPVARRQGDEILGYACIP